MANAHHYQNTFDDQMAGEFREILSVIDKSSLILLQNNQLLTLQNNKTLELNNGD